MPDFIEKSKHGEPDRIGLRDLDPEQLKTLNEKGKLAFQEGDLEQIQQHFEDLGRDPTRLELEVFAQTWSEHCKHRIFHARIHHDSDDETEIVDGIFQQYIENVTEEVVEEKPEFVVATFDDNAGFIRLDDSTAVCAKVETHNHPSAIDPYAGANTGVGGVIRDILGAGKGARPVAGMDVFCLGNPDCSGEELPDQVIHPLKMFRGVVGGVRDYGNRMGIPTNMGAIHFDDRYTFNPLVYCGTLGTIPLDDVEKGVKPGMKLLLVGGPTGRDGLHGATFSSGTLSESSKEEDSGAVQIGNPIEEKKVADFVLEARDRGLIETITDCGAGGISSAVGEMVAEWGGEVELDRVFLKEEDLKPWEIFLSESQERMVIACRPEDVEELHTLADEYQTGCAEIGRVSDHQELIVTMHGTEYCRLDCDVLHRPPRLELRSRRDPSTDRSAVVVEDPVSVEALLTEVLSSVNVCSRAPVIRQYDHEVQGNTVLKPLAGRTGDAPQDGVAVRTSGRAVLWGCAIQPEFARINSYRMGLSTVDEAVRQLVASGADPERIALLDNFCMGNPEKPHLLGRLVEAAQGMAEAAKSFKTPFISGKDSFYNSYELSDGRTYSIPMSLLITAVGTSDCLRNLPGTTVRNTNSLVGMIGITARELAGSVCANLLDQEGVTVPGVNPEAHRRNYERFFECVRNGWIRAAHDCSQGGLGVTLAEMGFGLNAGVNVDLSQVPATEELQDAAVLFSESSGRIVFEFSEENLEEIQERFSDGAFSVIGETTDRHRNLTVRRNQSTVIQKPFNELKKQWKEGLNHYF